MRTKLTTRPWARPFALASVLLAVSAFAGTGALAQGVVSLETPAPPGSQPSMAPDAAPTPPSDPQEAMLAYVECMREHGVDMPDPEFTADGGVIMRAGARAGEGDGSGDAGSVLGGPADEAFAEAHEACGSLMGGMTRDIDPAQRAEMEAQALAFARCMREHGIDMPDPRFDGNGGISIAIGGPGADRIDPDAMQEAQEACGGSLGFGAAPVDAEPQPSGSAAIP